MKRIVVTCMLLTMLAVIAGCGSSSSEAVPPQASVTVSPASVNVVAGQTQQFTATVSGSSSTAVTWSLLGTGCTGAACGTIDANGLYTAPSPIPASATITVTASAGGTPTQGTAKITHLPVAIAITPEAVSLISADAKQFTATVSNTPSGGSTAVTWTVTSGTINNGLYTAPAKVTTDTSVTVTATSVFDNTKSGKVTFLIKAPVVNVSPDTITLELGAQLRFVATVTNVPAGQTGVTWYLNGIGTLDSGGMYHSPMSIATKATDIIQAVPIFDDSKVGKAFVTLNPLVITISPKTVTLYPGQTHQFTSTVVNHVTKTVTWSVSGASCGGEACGTIDGNGLYTAPSSISNEVNVSVVVTSTADTTKSDTAVVTLKPITVTVSPKTANVAVTGTQQFAATVQGGTNTNVTWSVSGSGCTGNGCGTINSSGLYTAPAVAPVPATVTIKATAVADTSRSDTATVTVVFDRNVKLNGAYAFIFTGWDMSSKALDAIGSMVADGNGHLTGLIDMNGVNTAYRRINEAFTGTYQVDADGNRGQIVLNLSTGARTFRFAFDSGGSRGYFVLFESTGRYGSGMFKRQTTSDFSLSKLSGDYALGIMGMSSAGDERNAAVGRMHVDGAGAISNTSMDVANTGESPVNFSFTGSIAMSSSTGMPFGRATMAVSTGAETVNFTLYLVDAAEAYMIRTDLIGGDVPMFVGGMMKQRGGPFSAASFSGRSVFYMTGMLNQTIQKAAVTVGRFDVTNGAGFVAYTRNWGGTVFSGSESTVSAVIASNGRGTCTLATLGGPYVLYFVAPNTGFIMAYSNPGTLVSFGLFEPQSAGPFSNASLNGEYFGGAIAPATGSVDYGNGLQRWNGTGAWSGIGDNVGPGIGLQPNISVSGTYVITDSTSGAGNWQLTSPGVYNKQFYVISPDKIVFVPTETSNDQPTFEIFEK